MINAIYDRIREDVERVRELNKKYIAGTITEEEKEEWLAGLKGALNLSDLNRIESNCAYVANEIAVVVITKEWQITDIPRVSDYLRIRNNVECIRAAFATMSTTPITPVQPLNTFQKWNDIERILYDVDYIYTGMVENWMRCGDDVCAGEEIGVI